MLSCSRQIAFVILLSLVSMSLGELILYNQCHQEWEKSIMGDKKSTVCDQGHELSMLASMLANWGIRCKNEVCNPRTLNNWLLDTKGYNELGFNIRRDALMGLNVNLIGISSKPTEYSSWLNKDYGILVTLKGDQTKVHYAPYRPEGGRIKVGAPKGKTSPMGGSWIDVSMDDVIVVIAYEYKPIVWSPTSSGEPILYDKQEKYDKNYDAVFMGYRSQRKYLHQDGYRLTLFASMLANFGIKSGLALFNPLTLNNWLLDNGGFYPESIDIVDAKLEKLGVKYIGSSKDKTMLASWIQQGYGVLVTGPKIGLYYAPYLPTKAPNGKGDQIKAGDSDGRWKEINLNDIAEFYAYKHEPSVRSLRQILRRLMNKFL